MIVWNMLRMRMQRVLDNYPLDNIQLIISTMIETVGLRFMSNVQQQLLNTFDKHCKMLSTGA